MKELLIEHKTDTHTEDFPSLTTWESFESTEGNTILVAPTCQVPPDYLLPENWLRTTEMGNFRSVKSIDILHTGIKPNLVVKTPEPIYTRDLTKINAGAVWWGGPRTREKAMRLLGHPVIDEQIEREALLLFSLHLHGIPAELPQAIITTPQGRKKLIVQGIEEGSIATGKRHSQSKMLANELGYIMEDSTSYNMIRDSEGNDRIIDVNRWQLPPLTDYYQEQLVETVREAAHRLNAESETVVYSRKK